MDYYFHEFEKLQEEFEETIHHYPLFSEMIDKIEKDDIRDINELLEKNDEYYLKKAISKLKDLINYVKETSLNIKKEYDTFDKLANEWEKISLPMVDEKKLDDINDQVKKANVLIKKHDLNSIQEANRIMEKLIKEAR